ncbi:MAG: VCBS repeat-containing protein [Acidobacteriota bacterium]|nr:VCBS repeat-containing protein [Acidobacteriota bacterium]
MFNISCLYSHTVVRFKVILIVLAQAVCWFSYPAQIFGQCAISPSFKLTANFPVGASPKALVTGDFNLDGTPDIATTTNSFIYNVEGKITVLLGNRLWGFRTANEFPIGSTQTAAKTPIAIITADFNRDGKPDLATANQATRNISVLLGDGTGRFEQQQVRVFPSVPSPTSIKAGDFNNDGSLDLVVVGQAPGNDRILERIAVHLGNGTGHFGDANGQPIKQSFSNYPDLLSVATGDFNRDGKIDLAVVGFDSFGYVERPRFVTTLHGDGASGFAVANNYRLLDLEYSNSPEEVAVGDFNGDALPDLAVGLSHSTRIYLNSSSGFNKVGDVGHNLSRSIAIADLNGDGKTDIAQAMTGSGSDASIFVALGDGAGGLVQPRNIITGFGAYSVVSSDFDANGKADLAVTDYSSGNVYVLLNACGLNRKRWRGAAGRLLPTV